MYQIIVSFILGIAFELIFKANLAFIFFILIVSFSLYLILMREQKSKTIFLCVLFFCFGILRTEISNTEPDQHLVSQVGQNISFEGTITKEPDVRESSTRYTTTIRSYFSPEYPQKCTDIFLLENSSCSPRPGSQGISADTSTKNRNISDIIKENNFDAKNNPTILLIADRFPEFRYGDQIRVSGKLSLPKNFTNKNGGQFDYVSYLKKDGINFLISYPEIEKLTKKETGFWTDKKEKIFSSLYSFKNFLVDKISEVTPEPNSALTSGVIFGAKKSLGENLTEDFRTVGLIHIIVLSGYNLTIIAVGIFYALSFLNKRNLSFIISTIAIILFSIMVGLGATIIRAGIMALIAILARFLGRPADAMRWLFIAGFLMLLWNPLILFYDPSFQLSFMATLGLILFSPHIYKFISETKLQKFIPEKFGFREIISSTFAVQFFVLPMIIKMSGNFSIISFIINPLVLPIIPVLMAFGALTAFIGIFSEIISWPFGTISYLISEIIIKITEFSANLPFSSIQIKSVPTLLIFVWYTVYGVLYWKLKVKKTTLSLL